MVQVLSIDTYFDHGLRVKFELFPSFVDVIIDRFTAAVNFTLTLFVIV